ncbi:acyl-CoA dehydrogenase [Pseudomonas aeruginosa]|nr:acyl-CoA dehydrogenase [Pseudomonas aeruginosa]
MEENLSQAEAALEDLLNNFPSRFFGCALKVLVLPFGRRHKGPGDELDAEIAEILGRPDDDPALQAILAGAFLPKDPQDPVGAPRPRVRRDPRQRRAGEEPAQGDQGRPGHAAAGTKPDRRRRRGGEC